MIIIEIIILYFIQIIHTDDFPSTGTRLVNIIVESCFHGQRYQLVAPLIRTTLLNHYPP